LIHHKHEKHDGDPQIFDLSDVNILTQESEKMDEKPEEKHEHINLSRNKSELSATKNLLSDEKPRKSLTVKIEPNQKNWVFYQLPKKIKKAK
jgi:hypothetical protein